MFCFWRLEVSWIQGSKIPLKINKPIESVESKLGKLYGKQQRIGDVSYLFLIEKVLTIYIELGL